VAAGVKPYTSLILRNLFNLRSSRKAKKAALPGRRYKNGTKLAQTKTTNHILKFFTPLELGCKPTEAEQNLRNRFEIHKGRPDDVGEIAALRRAHFAFVQRS